MCQTLHRSPACYFNPHSHAGSDGSISEVEVEAEVISIHTPTQGVTGQDVETVTSLLISIHTPTQGVTALGHVIDREGVQFQSTLPRRE